MSQLGLTKITKPAYEFPRWDIPSNVNLESIASMLETLLTGYRYISGLEATNSSGLNLSVSAGVVQKDNTEVSIVADSFVLSDNATTFIYLDSANLLTSGNTLSITDIFPLYCITTLNGVVSFIGDLRNKIVQQQNKNLIDNPSFQVCQRGETTTFNEEYSADRWFADFVEDLVAHRDYSFATFFDFTSNYKGLIGKFSCVSNANRFFLNHKIEASALQNLFGKKVTLSFYMGWSGIITGAKTALRIYTPTVKDLYTSLTTAIPEFTLVNLDIANSDLERYTCTFEVTEEMVNKGVCFSFHTYNESANLSLTTTEIHFAAFKLEEGSFATEFIPNSFQADLERCKRFYQKIYVRHFSGELYTPNCDFRTTDRSLETTMRSTPSMEGTAATSAILWDGYSTAGTSSSSPLSFYPVPINTNIFSIYATSIDASSYFSGSPLVSIGVNFMSYVTATSDL